MEVAVGVALVGIGGGGAVVADVAHAVAVASIQVHVDDKTKTTSDDAADTKKDGDGKWKTLLVNKPVDLVLAQTETAAVKLGELPLPDGKITQIRLMLDSTQKNTAKVGDKTCDLDLSKVKDGLKINHPFKALDVGTGKKHQVWVDFKLDEAMAPTKDCYALKPVLRAPTKASRSTCCWCVAANPHR